MKKKRILALIMAFIMLFSNVNVIFAEQANAQVEYEYGLPYFGEEPNMLIGDESGIGNTIDVWYWDEEQQTEITAQVPITDVSITGNGVGLYGNEEEGWWFVAEEVGYAEITVTYQTMTGESDSYSFPVISTNERYFINLLFDEDCRTLFTDTEIEVGSFLVRAWIDENGDYQAEEITDYRLNVEAVEDGSLISVISNGQTLTITSGAAEGVTSFHIAASIDGRNVCITEEPVWVQDVYYNFAPVLTDTEGNEVVNLLGDDLDFPSWLKLFRYEKGKEAEQVSIESSDDFRICLEYDEAVWAPTDVTAGDLLPVLTRIRPYMTEIWVCFEANTAAEGEEPQWEIVTACSYWFDELDYSARLLLQEGDHGWIYDDGEMTFDMEISDTASRDCTIEVELGVYQEDGYLAFELPEGALEYIYDGSTLVGIKLSGEKLAQIEDENWDTYGFDVRTTVKSGDMIVSECGQGIDFRGVWCDYYYDYRGSSLLPHWGADFNKNISYYMKNSENPYGIQGVVAITSASVTDIEGENVVSIEEWEDGNGWRIQANNYGHAQLTITHEAADRSGEVTEVFDIWVGQDVWNVNIFSKAGMNVLLPGTDMELTAYVTRDCYTEEDGYFSGDVNVEYEWGYPEWADPDLLTLDQDENDPGILHVTASAEAEDGAYTAIYVRAYLLNENGEREKDENGNDIDVAYSEFEVWINREYFVLEPVSIDGALGVGVAMQVTPVLKSVSVENGEQVMDNAVFRWEYDTNAVEITDEGNGTYTIKKLENWGTEVCLIAELPDEYGNYNEVLRRYYWLDPVDYNIGFQDLRGGDHTWVFTDEEACEVSLDLSNLTENGQLKEGIELEWVVGKKDQQGEFINILDENAGYYTVSDDKASIILNGKKLAEDDFWGISVDVYVKDENGNIISETGTGVSLDEPEVSLLYDNRNMLIDTSELFSSSSLGAYIRNAAYPWGEVVFLKIDNITLQKTEENAPEPSDVFTLTSIEGGWSLWAKGCGYADIVIEASAKENAEEKYTIATTISVSEEIYYMDVYSDTNTDQMLPGGSLKLVETVMRDYWNEDGELLTDVLEEGIDYTVSYKGYDDYLIEVDENGNVSANGDFGNTTIRIEAVDIGDENIYLCDTSFWVNVTDSYSTIAIDPYYAKPGDTIFIEDMGVKVLTYTLENPEGIAAEPDDAAFYYPSREEDYYQISRDGKTIYVNDNISCDMLPHTCLLDFDGSIGGEVYWGFSELVIEAGEHTDNNGDDVCDYCGTNLKLFPDVNRNDWYYDCVKYVAEKGIIKGMADGTFNPEGVLDRAQFASILHRVAGTPSVEFEAKFPDVREYDWYAVPVIWAAQNGVVNGYQDGTFGPGNAVKREEMAIMMFNYAKKQEYVTDQRGDLSVFEDAGTVSWYAEEAMQWAVGAGIISGKNGVRLDPQGSATRAECAAIIQRFMENCKPIEK